MYIHDLYKGLEIEPPRASMIEQINLTARIVDPIRFIFLPERWEEQLKPFSKAKWKHETWMYSGGVKARSPHFYEIKEGAFLVFPQFNMVNGGFYAAHLYLIVKNMYSNQARATLTVDGLTIETVEGAPNQRVILKPRGMQLKDHPYHVRLS